MTRILASIVVVASLGLAASAGANPGSISGYVRNTAGVPQMGATVQLAGSAGQSQVAYTDARGYFTVAGLVPGNYAVQVSAPSFLPTLREDVVLAAGASKVLNITLSTLFEAVRMLPPLKKADTGDEGWTWTLRSTANRPVLRFDGDTAIMVETQQEGQPLKGTLALMAGAASEGYGSASDLGTVFNIEQSLFHSGTLAFAGNLGYGSGVPDGVMRASYARTDSDGWRQSVGLIVRRFSAPDTVPHGGALDAIAMSYSNGFSVGDLLDFQMGGEGQAIQFLGREVNAFRPSAIADLHLGPHTILEYRYATSEPNTRASKGFDSAPADLTETAPRMTMVDGEPLLENAHHHEVSLSQRFGANKLQLAYFNDRIKDPALLGVGDIDVDTGDILPDVYSGTFSYNGGELRAQGVRFVFQRRLSNSITATLDYAYGGVLELQQPNIDWSAVRTSVDHSWRHSAALKLNGTLPRCRTRWIASYRWTSGEALLPVDLFNASAGQTDPFFNLFFRQPLPHFHGMPGNMEALIDIRNLLAEGYVPIIGPDGNTVYLVQSARSVRGGVAFTF
ncbi:MAG TPA: carboxypeptidase-like regulatory domain-containing protein [Candidatus Binatia bacterium]|nr:carboxypeptidase-like regulatory domain-containing protein [Candidatus Binatia bacterium]